jgi:uncharacterized membrane protein YsdA (DUF1294 family)/cold shock CspA family protein
MRYQGKITNWKDEKGYGFITPNGGGTQVFVHIKSFASRRRRPVENSIVTYELTVDAKGRVKAEKVAFADERADSATSPASPAMPFVVAAIFSVFVTVTAFAGKLPFPILLLYLIGSAVAFLAYALDKSAAKNNQWRTAENTLHFFSLIGGWPGALIAQSLLRHKSKKESFQIVFWTTVILNCSALAWVLSASGANVLRAFLGRL